jgi:uncharacterized protein YdaU (DUF1376 family)
MTWGQFVHYYKFNISKWHLSTSHLTLEEEAVYFRLINFYYDTEQPIPLETQSVIRRLRLGSYSDIVQSVLEEFFTITESGWVHSVCDDLIAEYHLTADKNRKNGKSGGRPKKINELSDNPDKTQSVSTNNPEITLTKNYKLKTTNHNIYTDSFNEFWKIYPKHESKKEAAQAFSKITESLEVLIKAIKAQSIAKGWDKKENYGFIPHASTWLNQRRWEDEVVEYSSKPAELPLGTEQQIAHAYKVECGGDPTQSRFNSYFDMRKYILDQRDKRKVIQ